ncbi:MAG: type II toxin-antitoxin system VapB family antitoxin [Acidimicrobiaceae bacterium]|nr:type II toxin-antitoxin system VapB family antitoxin [Acidimicrobiaceae bacterium]MDE0606356.1 type II toxin-antitoxin system VapB family antitoxin [Acidimicrobiaceae bacterium]
MVLSIKNSEADQLARKLAELTGESITETVLQSLRARLEFERRHRHSRDLGDIVERFSKLAVLDNRQPDAIIGYDQHGLPS